MAQSALQRRQAEVAERVRQAREKLPISTAQLDQWREFFPDAKLTFAQEGTNRFGEPSPEGVIASDSSPSVRERKSKAPEKAIAAVRQRELVA